MEFQRASPFLLLCIAGALAILSTTMAKNPALPLFAAHLGAGPSGIGLVAALSPLAGVAVSAPAGVLSDRLGRRRLLLASGAVFALAPFSYLLVATVWQLAAARFIHGLATGIFMPVAMALVTDLHAGERGLRLGSMSTATMLGRFAAPILGGALLALGESGTRTGFQAVYWACGLAGAAALACLLALPEAAGDEPSANTPVPRPADLLDGLRRVLAVRQVLAGCMLEAAVLFGYGVFEVFLPLKAVAAGISAPATGAIMSAQVLAVAATKPLFGKWSDAHGRRGQMLAGGSALAVCLAGMALAEGPAGLTLLAVLLGLGLSVSTSASAAFIADESPPDGRGAAMGILGSIMDVGHTAGPLLGGVAAAALGVGAAFWLGTAALLTALGIFARLSAGRRTA